MRLVSRIHQEVRVAIASSRLHLSRHVADDRTHLEEAMAWLARAQDAVSGHGVSISYSPDKGWHPDPYPETSGYILATFLRHGQLNARPEFIQRAHQLAQWLVSIQRADGATLSSVRDSVVRVFNTGQVLLGWCSILEAGEAPAIREAAVRAGHFLVGGQEPDGSWVKDTYCGARTYHARVAWSLLRLALLTGDETCWEAGRRNLLWTLAQQNAAGWFRNCGFHQDAPITHVLGYTLRGVLESHQLLSQRDAKDPLAGQTLEAAARMANALCRVVANAHLGFIPGMLPAAFDESWKPVGRHACLTGNAQLAIDLMRMEHITAHQPYRAAAWSLLDAVKATQDITGSHPGSRGALAGSFPFRGGYLGGAYPNWATKFLADALLMRVGAASRWKVDA